MALWNHIVQNKFWFLGDWEQPEQKTLLVSTVEGFDFLGKKWIWCFEMIKWGRRQNEVRKISPQAQQFGEDNSRGQSTILARLVLQSPILLFYQHELQRVCPSHSRLQGHRLSVVSAGRKVWRNQNLNYWQPMNQDRWITLTEILQEAHEVHNRILCDRKFYFHTWRFLNRDDGLRVWLCIFLFARAVWMSTSYRPTKMGSGKRQTTCYTIRRWEVDEGPHDPEGTQVGKEERSDNHYILSSICLSPGSFEYPSLQKLFRWREKCLQKITRRKNCLAKVQEKSVESDDHLSTQNAILLCIFATSCWLWPYITLFTKHPALSQILFRVNFEHHSTGVIPPRTWYRMWYRCMPGFRDE